METDFYHFFKHIHRLSSSKYQMNMILSASEGKICIKRPNSNGSHFLLTSKFLFHLYNNDSQFGNRLVKFAKYFSSTPYFQYIIN